MRIEVSHNDNAHSSAFFVFLFRVFRVVSWETLGCADAGIDPHANH